MMNKISELKFKMGLIITVLSLVTACGGGSSSRGVGNSSLGAVDLAYITKVSGIPELFVSSTDGTVQRGSTSSSVGTVITDENFIASPDGRYIAIRRELIPEVYELFVDDLNDAAEAYRVNGDLVSGGDVKYFKWSPDSTHIAYRADQDIDDTVELYVVPAEGGSPIKLHPDQTGSTIVPDFNWSPDSQKIAFRATHSNIQTLTLYSVNRDASNLQSLSVMAQNGGHVGTGYKWSSDSSRIAYRINDDADVENQYDLYLVNADATGNTKINSGGHVSSFKWSPSDSIAYRADQDTPGINELYHRGTGNIAFEIKLNGPLIDGGVVTTAWDWSPNGSYIAYKASQNQIGVHELYVSNSTNTFNVRVNTELNPGSSLKTFRWSPDSRKLAYTAEQDTPGLLELYVSRTTNSFASNEKMNQPVTMDVNYFDWSPADNYLAYVADQDTTMVPELYVVNTQPACLFTCNYKLNNALLEGGIILPSWSPTGSHLSYLATQVAGGQYELYTAPNFPGAVTANIGNGNIIEGYVWIPVLEN